MSGCAVGVVWVLMGVVVLGRVWSGPRLVSVAVGWVWPAVGAAFWVGAVVVTVGLGGLWVLG